LQKEDTRDLGFGSRVARASRRRLLNQDGSFNVRRRGLSIFESLSLFHTLLTTPWWVFHLIVLAGFLLYNALFAAAYMVCGEGALSGIAAASPFERFLELFFFSVQTSTTLGYGHVIPLSAAANILSSFEVTAGLLGFALVTGMMFARVSRPSANIVFSRHAVVAPYQGSGALMFRLANRRSIELLDVNVAVTLSRFEGEGENRKRRFYELALSRESVRIFPLNWTIVHPMDEQSPLHGTTREAFAASGAEILVLLTATDETFSQIVHARTSYTGEEIVWGARFSDMFSVSSEGTITVDLHRIHNVEPSTLPL
jgi:inward rectifier potassium channel